MKKEQATISKAPKHKGVVVSNKMQKTIVVKVDTLKAHPKYQKRYISSKRYKVHSGDIQFAIGDVVVFRECKPYSKDKKHEVVSE